jgi:hypothetical protein
LEFTLFYEMSLEQEEAGLSSETVQEMSKSGFKQGRRSKTDVRYWESAIFQPSYSWRGAKRKVGHWAVKVQYGGRRETVPLGTANKTAAASKAKEFYLCLQSGGWNEALAKFKPKSRWSNRTRKRLTIMPGRCAKSWATFSRLTVAARNSITKPAAATTG